MTMKTAYKQEIKQLRSDARKLDAIANHLRARAKQMAEDIRSADRAEKARANFYSKPSAVDGSIPLTPELSDNEQVLAWEDK